MEEMFYGAKKFNQPLNNWGDKTRNVKNMANMFKYSVAFVLPSCDTAPPPQVHISAWKQLFVPFPPPRATAFCTQVV